jgi:hypothetical protein
MLTNRNTVALVLCVLASQTAGADYQQPAKRAGMIEPLPISRFSSRSARCRHT